MPIFGNSSPYDQSPASPAPPVPEVTAADDDDNQHSPALHRLDREDPPLDMSTNGFPITSQGNTCFARFLPKDFNQLTLDKRMEIMDSLVDGTQRMEIMDRMFNSAERTDIMEHPLDDAEMSIVVSLLPRMALPQLIYTWDFWHEYKSLERRCRGRYPKFLKGKNALLRENIICHHYVRRRWEKLGVWNPTWRYTNPFRERRDDWCRWAWRWQTETSGDKVDRRRHSRDVVARGVHLRRNLRRGEKTPILPRSHPGPDATAAEAEAFLVSRPWFQFSVEVAEERVRSMRLANNKNNAIRCQERVVEWWKERGDWRDDYGQPSDADLKMTAWRWRDESPEPEPEDIAPIYEMPKMDIPESLVKKMEFTRSEIDGLELISLADGVEPDDLFNVTSDTGSQALWPGDTLEKTEDDEKSGSSGIQQGFARTSWRAKAGKETSFGAQTGEGSSFNRGRGFGFFSADSPDTPAKRAGKGVFFPDSFDAPQAGFGIFSVDAPDTPAKRAGKGVIFADALVAPTELWPQQQQGNKGKRHRPGRKDVRRPGRN
ncbi:hypothetical protein SPI_05235 [Niveomyces insectorum RCEF 264]|uniref:Uncharacterized protein n=1 Tax=Niveomyces insectorum RCEF 264 TaxID=1081102 RepID=A0A167U3I9_9HYPO|nr:hypothetical protein SPI_05235 [Niveomyces insectorum RCEF 264]